MFITLCYRLLLPYLFDQMKFDVKVSLTFTSKLSPFVTHTHVKKPIVSFRPLPPSMFAIATPAPNRML